MWSLVVFQCCPAQGLVVDAWVQARGSGLDFQRKPLLALVERISAGAGGVLVLAHQDRLARVGFPLNEHRCARHPCELLVLNQQSLSPEPALRQDMLSML